MKTKDEEKLKDKKWPKLTTELIYDIILKFMDLKQMNKT